MIEQKVAQCFFQGCMSFEKYDFVKLSSPITQILLCERYQDFKLE